MQPRSDRKTRTSAALLAVLIAAICVTASAAETNLAVNTSGSGFPSPLASDRGWGGGSYVWEIVDGSRHYPQWYHGLAFTGGHTDSLNPDSPGYIEPAGVRQATIDFGQTKRFHKVVIWHHGDEHAPASARLERWDGRAWVNIPFERRYESNFVSAGAGSKPDKYTFAEVSGSKVRYSLDNRERNIVGTWNIHGWLYEFEVVGATEPPPPSVCVHVSQVEVCYDTVTGAWYQLQYRSTLTAQEWTPLSSRWVAGDGERKFATDAVGSGQPQRFYRVAVTNTPPAP